MKPVRVDLSVLEEYVGSDPVDLAHYVQLGIKSLREALAPLNQAIADSNLATMQACGHRSKSTALHLGAQTFADAGIALEASARLGQLREAKAIAQTLLDTLPPLEQALQQALQDHQSRKKP